MKPTFLLLSPYMETFLPVLGFEGVYSVSDYGSVRRENTGLILSPGNCRGHLTVSLWRNNRPTMKRVHRLVLESHVRPALPGEKGLHWDDDKLNNHVSNLRWGTQAQNIHDSVRNGTHAMLKRTHCPQGHEYTAENTYHKPNGARECRICKRARTNVGRKR